MGKTAQRLNRSATGGASSMSLTLFARLGSLPLGVGIEVQIESKFRKRFERKGEQHAVFFYTGVVPYHAAE
jgi:hypothetical protein